MNAVLVGGGNAAVVLLDFFGASKNVKVIGVSDIKEDAPGIARARSLGIPTTTRTEELLERPGVDMIIELTGNSQVQAALFKNLHSGQEIMSATCAKLMRDMIVAQSAHDATVAETVSEQFKVSISQLQTVIENVDVAFANVEKLLRETGLITLNAKIESARAGQAGDAFGIVVNRMTEMLNSIRDAMEKIAKASAEGHETLAGLKAAKDQLAHEFKL